MQSDSGGKPDVEAIMASIRKQAKTYLSANQNPVKSFIPLEVKRGNGSLSPLLYRDELNYLNANWQNWVTTSEITSHRPFLGGAVVNLKKFLVNIVWKHILKGYFEREKDFQMRLVTFLNDTARYVDGRDAEIFWQLIQKIDGDLLLLDEKMRRLVDRRQATEETKLTELEKRVDRLEQSRAIFAELLESSHRDLVRLDEICSNLERGISRLENAVRADSSSLQMPNVEPVGGNIDFGEGRRSNALLQRYQARESEVEVRQQLKEYLPYFDGIDGVIVDLGCGRGELLELLREAGRESFGVELNPSLARIARDKNLAVTEADYLSYLEQLSDSSIGGIFACNLIECLEVSELDRLLTLCMAKVVSGGRVIFETANPQSVTGMTRNFYRDPAHLRPIHPEALRYLMERKGIRTERLSMRAPYSRQALLQPLALGDDLPARFREMVEQLNENLTRLNSLLFGHQQFAIIGTVEKPGAQQLIAEDRLPWGTATRRTGMRYHD